MGETRLFLKPGKTNKEDRENFVRLWAQYIRTTNDVIWSKQQNIVINSQIENIKNFYKNLEKTKKGKEILKRLKEERLRKKKVEI